MTNKKRPALGRGLSALLPDRAHFDDIGADERIIQVEISRLSPDPNQPRRLFDEDKLAELAESIRQFGIMQPLIVMAEDKDHYRIVAGERRYRAAKLAELKQIPCIVRKYNQGELAEISLIENIQREDLSALEEAEAYRNLLDSFGYTQEALAERLGKSRPHIANTLRLLQLSPQYRNLLQEGRLSAGHARAILSLSDPRLQSRLADAILSRHLSVRQTEELAKLFLAEKSGKKPLLPRVYAAHLRDLEKRFTSRIGLPVRLAGSLEKGKLTIAYQSSDDLENLIDALLEE